MDVYEDTLPMVFDVLFVAAITWIFLSESYEVINSCREQRFNFYAFVVSYFDFWDIIDWLSVILGYTVMGVWMNLCFKVADVREMLLHLEANDRACLKSGGPTW